MKRTKKLLVLVLAMMMAFTALVLPAAAHGDEGIMLLGEVIKCPDCSGIADVTSTPKLFTGEISVFYCPKNPVPHIHKQYAYTKIATCRDATCGYSKSTPMASSECK